MKKILLFIVLVMVGLLIWRFSIGKEAVASVSVAELHRELGRPVGLERPMRVDMARTVSIEGDVEAFLDVACQSDVEGRLVDMPFKVGSVVRVGQVVARIDEATFRASHDQALAALAVARATLAKLERGARPEEKSMARARLAEAEAALSLATREKSRLQRLKVRQAATSQQLDAANAHLLMAQARVKLAKRALALVIKGPRKEDLQVARAHVAAAEAAQRGAATDLARTEVKAPISGVVRQRNYEKGELVKNMPSPAQIYRIADLERVYLVAMVSELDVVHLKMRQAVTVRADALIAARGKAGERQGEVAEIAPAGDSRSRAFRVKVIVANPDRALRPGMFARGRVLVQSFPKSLAVNRSWIVKRDGEHGTVFLVRDGRVVAKRLRLGLVQGELVQVLDGLAQTDLVINEGLQGLGAGDRVRDPRLTGKGR